MKKLIILSLVTLSVAGGIARASEDHKCDVPKDKWMTEEAMKAKAVELGFDVRQVKVEDGCYEVYGIKDGNKVEAIFNPQTGEQIGSEGED